MNTESSKIKGQNRAIIVMLVINDLGALPQIAIESVLRVSDSDIIIGYINKSDIANLSQFTELEFLDLTEDALRLELKLERDRYRSFDEDYFFQLVQLKWCLINRILNTNPDFHVIYSDLDVLWVKNVSQLIGESFKTLKDAHVLIQSYTANPANPRLCMGIVAFRNSFESRDILEKCIELHKSMLQSNPRIGDDDVITHYYKNSEHTSNIRELPQVMFPVGNLLNLYSRKNLYPALHAETPYVFHANHVVGLQKKIELLEIFSKNQSIPLQSISLRHRLYLKILVRLRFAKYNLKQTIYFLQRLER